MTELQILWSILGGVGTLVLTLIGAGIIALVKATNKNTTELAVLNSKIEGMVAKTDKITKLEEDVIRLGLLYRDQKELLKNLSGHSRPQ